MSSTKPTKRNTIWKTQTQTLAQQLVRAQAQPSNTEPNIPNPQIAPIEHPSQPTASTVLRGTAPNHDHDDQTTASTPAPDAKLNSTDTDTDLTTWSHLSLERSGARLRTVCTEDHEDGVVCAHSVVRERKYPDIPRVDGPSEKITHEVVEEMMERDRRVEIGEGEEEWVFVGGN